jgi:hypothetical protein
MAGNRTISQLEAEGYPWIGARAAREYASGVHRRLIVALRFAILSVFSVRE